jgi:hypothetical protein
VESTSSWYPQLLTDRCRRTRHYLPELALPCRLLMSRWPAEIITDHLPVP